MPVPKTFSGPGESYVPSYEDSLRYAVWLMFWNDTLNRTSHEDRVYQVRMNQDPETGLIVTPQQGVAVRRSVWTYRTGKGGRKSITIAVMDADAPDLSFLTDDVSAPAVTPETKVARMEEIIMRGTVWKENQESHDYLVVDPYNSPLDDNGYFDQDHWRILTNKLPDVVATAKETIPNRFIKSRDEQLGLKPVSDFVVIYGVLATYDIEVPDRERQHGGN